MVISEKELIDLFIDTRSRLQCALSNIQVIENQLEQKTMTEVYCLNKECDNWKQVDKEPEISRGKCKLLLMTVHEDGSCLSEKEKK